MLRLKKIPVKKTDYPKPLAEDVPYYNPSFSLNDKQVSEIKDWDVGETYQLCIEVSMTSKQEYKDGGVSGGFDIIAYKSLGENMSDGDMEEMQGQAMANKE